MLSNDSHRGKPHAEKRKSITYHAPMTEGHGYKEKEREEKITTKRTARSLCSAWESCINHVGRPISRSLVLGRLLSHGHSYCNCSTENGTLWCRVEADRGAGARVRFLAQLIEIVLATVTETGVFVDDGAVAGDG